MRICLMGNAKVIIGVKLQHFKDKGLGHKALKYMYYLLCGEILIIKNINVLYINE